MYLHIDLYTNTNRNTFVFAITRLQSLQTKLQLNSTVGNCVTSTNTHTYKAYNIYIVYSVISHTRSTSSSIKTQTDVHKNMFSVIITIIIIMIIR